MSMTYERKARGQNTNKRDGPKTYKPTADDFKPANVVNVVRADALCHPATIYPLFGSIGAAVCAIAIPATLPVAAGLATLGLVVSGTSWYYNYLVKGKEKVAERYATLRQLRRQQEKDELDRLVNKCTAEGFAQGSTDAQKLEKAYQTLLDFFHERSESNSNSTIEEYQSEAAQAYKKGVSMLAAALDIAKALDSSDLKELKRENEKLKKQQSQETDGSAKFKALARQIESTQREIDLFTKREELQLELLTQVSEIKSDLKSTYLELVDLGNRDVTSFLSTKGAGLRSRVEAARRVEEMLRGDSAEELEKQRQYLQAADDAANSH